MGDFIALTPSYKPVGGVVKVFDYVNHARQQGLSVRVHCSHPYEADAPLFQNERFSRLSSDPEVSFIRGHRIGVRPDDIVFFSWPTDWQRIAPRLPAAMARERVIHIIQNVRHANPHWIRGYGARLLGRPMTRIMIVPEVADAVSPFVHPESLTEIIPEGHDWPYFHKLRVGGLPQRIKVAYTTWKSEVGIAVEESLSGDDRFEFRSVRKAVGWPELKDLYQWADVFLATPLAEEGFYLPGLEAMAAGAVVVTPDAGGNRAYCDFGENCIHVELEDGDSYTSALEALAAMPAAKVAALRTSAYEVLENHTLDAEEARFGHLLSRIGI